MNEIQDLRDQCNQLRSEAETLQAEMLPLETVLESDAPIEPDHKRELREKYNELKRKFDSLNLNADLLDRRISRRENLANCDSLMADYIQTMNNWKADEQELNEKRQSLSSRLEQIQQQAEEDMTKARQAETDAATAYAQAVAWGDTEGERAANADAQKAAKNLTAAAEHNRRQTLIMAALEQELVTVDKYIAEAQVTYGGIEHDALWLSRTVLEEQWNEAAKALLEVGGKLWANYNLLGHDPVGLMKLAVPEQGENHGRWGWHELIDRSRQYSALDLLHLDTMPIPQQPADMSNPEQRKDEHNEQANTKQRELV